MSYEKRLCILKQIKRGFSADGGEISGAVYAERLGGELILTPRIVALAPVREGRYAFAVWVGGKEVVLELKRNGALKIPSMPSLKEGFSVLLCFIRFNAKAEPIAFGRCGSAPASYESLLSLFEEKKKSVVPAPIPPEPPAVPEISEYHDEAIAEDNYYGEKQPPAVKIDGRNLTYYNMVKEKLYSAMKNHPSDNTLLWAFPHSEWVRTEEGLLGVIYEEGLPRYLCVAVEKGKPLPEKFQEEAIFVPRNEFQEEEGYYIVFQDADTGNYVKVSDE